jgi:tetratricopeptide (TPR) repeat protein
MGRHSDPLKSYREAVERYVHEVIGKLEANTGESLSEEITIKGKKAAMMNMKIMDKMSEVLRSEPTYAILKDNIGRVYLALGDLDAAKENFEESIDHIPRGFNFPAPYYGLKDIAAIR